MRPIDARDNDDGKYVGTELELFAAAIHWKGYLGTLIKPMIQRNVLEVGAGVGGTTLALCDGTSESWTCLEPDAGMAATIDEAIASGKLPACCRTHVGTIDSVDSVAPPAGFDTILYIDVLEHIEDDRGEAARAAERLAPGGRLIVLSPAHQWLFSEFDAAIGHHRRYTRASLRAAVGDALKLERLVYLDSVGLFASAANRMLLRQSMPTARQIATWDNLLVPLSRAVDPLLAFALGKSVLGVWQQKA